MLLIVKPKTEDIQFISTRNKLININKDSNYLYWLAIKLVNYIRVEVHSFV